MTIVLLAATLTCLSRRVTGHTHIDSTPTVSHGWIEAMVYLGICGVIVNALILVFGSYQYLHCQSLFKQSLFQCTKRNNRQSDNAVTTPVASLPKVSSPTLSNSASRTRHDDMSRKEYLTFLTICLWFCNFIACLFWALLRSDSFVGVGLFTPTYCAIVYLCNFLFYLIGKFCLQLILVYRIHLTFRGTMFDVNATFLFWFAIFITVNFVVSTSIWIWRVHDSIQIGITTEGWHICTLYNSDSDVGWDAKIYPIYFGAQDFVVSTITLFIFVKKIYITATTNDQRSITIYPMMKKLCILGVTAILSTFCFYTFAVPFYPDATFLIAADTMINSLSMLLIPNFANGIYSVLCFPCDYTCDKLITTAAEAGHLSITPKNSSLNPHLSSRDSGERQFGFFRTPFALLKAKSNSCDATLTGDNNGSGRGNRGHNSNNNNGGSPKQLRTYNYKTVATGGAPPATPNTEMDNIAEDTESHFEMPSTLPPYATDRKFRPVFKTTNAIESSLEASEIEESAQLKMAFKDVKLRAYGLYEDDSIHFSSFGGSMLSIGGGIGGATAAIPPTNLNLGFNRPMLGKPDTIVARDFTPSQTRASEIVTLNSADFMDRNEVIFADLSIDNNEATAETHGLLSSDL